MTDAVSFQTRARTIDHLGRGQIADAPTAVSELWKNAYDAYARNVALHLFGGSPKIGAIFDDGVGMNKEDILSRWLVIGTESKLEALDGSMPDTLGLPQRVKQGEKGIGRLSAAFLAPAIILISKRKGFPFVVVVVDWRLFENPYLSLDDVRLPISEFETLDAVMTALPMMIQTLRRNLGKGSKGEEKRISEVWTRFSDNEVRAGQVSTTASAIEALWTDVPLARRHLEEWDLAHGLIEHGTAMFLIDLNHELGVWSNPSSDDDEIKLVKDKLYYTLTAFTDPYNESAEDFNYEVYLHVDDRDNRIISSSEMFGIDDLRELEHLIEGRFDEKGVFTGSIRAFGQDLGLKTIEPARPPAKGGRDRLGPFDFAIGTFELDERRSTHESGQWAMLLKQAEKFAGVAVYRDTLRVMPYGRPDADFLGMEERRSKHAGREFWAHRRSFGHVAFTRQQNPALRDKAGREGLVDNRAFRELRLLIVHLLQDVARRYFGTDAPLRKEFLGAIMERKAVQKESADKAKLRRRQGIRQFLKEQAAPLEDARRRIAGIVSLAEDTLQSKDRVQAAVVAARALEMRALVPTLRPPVPPAQLGDLEDRWRDYRDGYSELSDQVQKLAELTAKVDSVIEAEDPGKTLAKRFDEQQKLLTDQLRGFEAAIDESFIKLRSDWNSKITSDEVELKARVGHILEAKVTVANLAGYLNLLDANRDELSETFAAKYGAFLGALAQLLEGIDLEGAYSVTEDDRADLEARLRDIEAVAQVGITVEIIGHEFETFDAEVKRNLSKLPASVKDTKFFKQALRAHQSISDRFRFLSPLKIAGYRLRETITGNQIADYIGEFFSGIFQNQRIDFTATNSFRGISITDIPSRIFPVFINLINNAAYWTLRSEDRRIVLDFQEGKAVVADSGPGVDPDDVSRLFSIFFTRRHRGRGVGLYLSRANLAVAGHKIRYATADDPRVLPGANFIIEFKGVRHD